jgi:hypothetical protein
MSSPFRHVDYIRKKDKKDPFKEIEARYLLPFFMDQLYLGPNFEANTFSNLSYSQRYLKKYAVSETALMQLERRQRQH